MQTGKHRQNVPTYMESRAIREAYNARITKLEYEKLLGELISKKEVQDAAFSMARAVRDAILNVPMKHAPELAAETDPFMLEQKLSSALEFALAGLADGRV